MVLLNCGEKGSLGDPFFLELARGFEAALSVRGYGPVVNAVRETVQRWVGAEGVAGVILATGTDRKLLARELAEHGTACVIIAQEPVDEIPGVGWVTLDLRSGARDVARMLLDLGHQRIGFIGSYHDDFVREGFSTELKRSGMPLNDKLEVLAGAGRVAGLSAMQRLLELPEPPTAVFARTDLLASGALEAAREMGARVPEDVSVVGHDDIPLAETLGLTTVRIDCMELGQAATAVLTRLRTDWSAPKSGPTVRTQIVARNTVGPAQSAEDQ